MMRLTLLFATFVFAYILRMIYQLGLGTDFYVNIINRMVIRWGLIMALPLLWDITSLISIFILHFKSFRSIETDESQQRVMPKAGHYNE